jgi:hypothetical protein
VDGNDARGLASQPQFQDGLVVFELRLGKLLALESESEVFVVNPG